MFLPDLISREQAYEFLQDKVNTELALFLSAIVKGNIETSKKFIIKGQFTQLQRAIEDIGEGSDFTRELAAEAIARLQIESGIDDLIQILQNPFTRPTFRTAVMHALADSATSDAVDALCHFIADKTQSSNIRYDAALALAKINSPAVQKCFKERLDRPEQTDCMVLSAAVTAFADFGVAEDVPKLLALYDSEWSQYGLIGESVITALAGIGNEQSIQYLVNQLQSTTAPVWLEATLQGLTDNVLKQNVFAGRGVGHALQLVRSTEVNEAALIKALLYIGHCGSKVHVTHLLALFPKLNLSRSSLAAIVETFGLLADSQSLELLLQIFTEQIDLYQAFWAKQGIQESEIIEDYDLRQWSHAYKDGQEIYEIAVVCRKTLVALARIDDEVAFTAIDRILDDENLKNLHAAALNTFAKLDCP